MITFTIDNKKVSAKEGATVFEVAREYGIEIPHLCYHKDMEPYGGCRLCMVEITENGFTRLHPSCAFPVKNNIIVKTDTERLRKGRKMIAELLLARCPDVDIVKNLAEFLGVNETRFKKMDSDCVLCGQCVRVCRNVAKVGAIDFINRGKNRYVGTPFDLPSDDCIGCGSCHYVCPTGSMNMEYENVLRWRNLPGTLRKCRYMRMGFISHKMCPNNYQCWNCELDQRMEDLAKTHPIFMLKHSRSEEKETIGHFEIRFDRFYHEGHVWVKRINGLMRLGIDDFTRQILGTVSDMRLPFIDTVLEPEDTLFEIFGNERTLLMYAPLGGKIININPDILDNPSLVSMAPYERGWILTVEPLDIPRASRELLSGRSAKEWLKLESHKFHEFIKKETGTDLPFDKPIPKDFAKTVSKDTWKKIHKIFFIRKKKKNNVKLFRIEDIP
ncbi:MAG: 2Fe-2S iron-sulfur cluster binding domain-containing protein [Flavobacteriales bacterium]|jgi:bidirectional [NiFe] hydrogenase diaphorase subunit|nr:MAG: 2Fe-2S iron-sulfur cluster binding domain-containing protein [Flavobacteriales bacterium]